MITYIVLWCCSVVSSYWRNAATECLCWQSVCGCVIMVYLWWPKRTSARLARRRRFIHDTFRFDCPFCDGTIANLAIHLAVRRA
jgi:aminoglycoside phosphotransferase